MLKKGKKVVVKQSINAKSCQNMTLNNGQKWVEIEKWSKSDRKWSKMIKKYCVHKVYERPQV